jgi:lipoprotein-anchoring transpeptidase ErfK/SrfK
MRFKPSCSVFFLFLTVFSPLLTEAAEKVIVVSIRDQKLAVIEDGESVAEFPVSTSKFGLGDRHGSYATPLGEMQIAQKIGTNAPLGAVFKSRRMTGEVLRPNARGRDPIVTRILWLRGLESRNAHAYERAIYIHGTAEERTIGRPASYGCIRMRSKDVVRLYDTVGVGAHVNVVNQSLSRAVTSVTGGRPSAPATERRIAKHSVQKAKASYASNSQSSSSRIHGRLYASLPVY